MGFILKEDIVYVHCKLTDEGRKKIASGKFTPTKFSVGDSEINYKYYNHLLEEDEVLSPFEDSNVLSPIDRFTTIKNIIKSNTDDDIDKYDLINLGYSGNTYTRDVEEIGFFDGLKYNYEQKNLPEYIIQGDFRIDISQLNRQPEITKNNIQIRKTVTYGPNVNEPVIGDYILINWNNPYSSGENFVNGSINSVKFTPFLWYKILEITGDLSDNTIELTLDRELPNFGTSVPGNQYYSYGFIFPKYNSMRGFYNSIYPSDYWEKAALDFQQNCNTPPIETNIWNLNILMTDDLVGLGNLNNKNNPSDKYAGFLNFIRDSEFTYNNIGIIHYTNNNPTHRYGEKFEDEVVINLPTIMWHKNEDNRIGVEFKSDGIIQEFTDSGLFYYNLIDDWNNIVGTIFPDLKIILITDQEILFAMSFKSNRNWTLLEPVITFNSNRCVDDDGETGTIYYGTKEVLGSFVTIPLPADIDINDSTTVDNLNLESFAVSIPFNSGDNDFIWVAIPQGFTVRTKWFVNVFNQGNIGGAKIISGNLFPDPENIVIGGINYTIYISNYRTAAEYVNLLL